MAVFQNNLLAGAGAQSSDSIHTIDQSIRFDDAAEHFMYSPTPSSGKDFSTTCTISLWFKIANLKQGILAGSFYGSNARYNLIQITSDGQLKENDRVGGASTATGTGGTSWITTRVFRDPSAWYHAVFVWDTTNAVQSERFRLYINGVRETDFATAPSLGASELVYWFGKSSYTTLGAYFNGTGYADTLYFDGYMAEMHGIDGTALDQDSFGEFNSSGIWIPKEYTGSHGTDGFYIKGADASDLGINSAANGNDFTLNAISSHDQVPDSPTNNFCVMSPIDQSGFTLSEGNLKTAYGSNNSTSGVKGTVGISTGKWYWEGRRNSANVYHCQVAVASSEVSPTKLPPSNTPDNGGSTVGYWGTSLYKDGVAVQTVAASGNGDIIGLALDLDSSPNTVTFTKNGSALGTAVSVTSGFTWTPCEGTNPSGYTASVNTSHNFGQDGTMAGNITAGGNSDANGIGDFKYSVPSGHLSVCTKNVGS
jgi:hypothetical protein